LCGKYNAYPVI